MILVIGGAFQGKRETASQISQIPKENFLDGKECPLESVFSCSGIYHFEEYIRRCMLEAYDMSGFVERLITENPSITIVMRELGYGLVPMDAFEREFREKVGRIGCELALEARKVVRVICGMGTVIKDD